MALIPHYRKYITDIGTFLVSCSRNREEKEKPDILHNDPNTHLSFSFLAYCILYNTLALRASFFAYFTKKMWECPEKIRKSPKHMVSKTNHSYAWRMKKSSL